MKPRVLLNFLRAREKAPTIKNYPAPNITLPQLRNPVSDKEGCYLNALKEGMSFC